MAAEFWPLIIVTAPAGCVAGSIVGAIETETKSVVESTTASTTRTVQSNHLQTHFIHHICQLTQVPMAPVDIASPSKKIITESTPWQATSFDTILNITIAEIATREAIYNTSLFSRDVVDVLVKVHVRLTRTKGGETSYEGDYFYRSKPFDCKGFKKWCQNNSELFLSEVKQGLRIIAEEICSDIFPSASSVPAPSGMSFDSPVSAPRFSLTNEDGRIKGNIPPQFSGHFPQKPRMY